MRPLFERIFRPRAVAVAGASREPSKHGYRIIKSLADGGYKGTVYPINPRAKEIYGIPAYPSIESLPGPVDYVAAVVAAADVPGVVRQTADKGGCCVQILSAFEQAEAPGLLALARGRGVRLIGPNCRGIYCAESLLNWDYSGEIPAGGVGFISQSGGFLLDFIEDAPHLSLGLNKAISVGDCWDMDHCDFLAHYAEDPGIRVAGCYIETARHARRFLETIAGAAPRKPVVVMKGGRTELGGRAALSHTGALAGDMRLWRGGLRQAGAIEVDSLEELTAAMTVLDKARIVEGEGVALVGQGGGATVAASDLCGKWGIPVRPFAPRTRKALDALSLPPGCTLTNPVDIPRGVLRGREGKVLGKVLDVIEEDPAVDLVLMHLDLHSLVQPQSASAASSLFPIVCDALAERAHSARPLWVTFRPGAVPEARAAAAEQMRRLHSLGLPVFDRLDFMISLAARWRRYCRRRRG